MLQIIGYSIPDNKKLYIALCYIYGIGQYSAKRICAACNISIDTKAGEIDSMQLQLLSKYIRENYITGIDLKKYVINNIQKLIEIGCYRGVRAKYGLPRRGQRTKCNAKTVRKMKSLHMV